MIIPLTYPFPSKSAFSQPNAPSRGGRPPAPARFCIRKVGGPLSHG